MDEFKPEDELKPDTSDRRPQRSRKTSSAPKVPVSRQQMMMGVGILVLLLLVIGIGSTLNGPSDKSGQSAEKSPSTTSGSGNSIDLSGSSSMSGQSGDQQPTTDVGNGAPAAGSAPQELSAPPVSSTPTEAQPVQTPAGQQRVELPGDLNSALSNQQNQVDAASQESTLPTAAATVAGGEAPRQTTTSPRQATTPPRQPADARQPSAHQNKPAAAHQSAAAKPATAAPQRSAPAKAAASSAGAPGGNYTLQLSSASRSDTLNAWAKKQNLSGYHVYKTTRNNQPWYVLVSGSYATPAEAKRAVASLPADVRAKNPWVKPVSQVKKEAAN